MGAQVRVLFTACERVPGPTASGAGLAQLILNFSGPVEADGLSIKSEELAHIQRLGTARMMRVPAPEEGFVERVSAFQRALKRQLEGDGYDLVHAADAWAGAVAAQHKENCPDLCLVTDLREVPSQTLLQRWPDLQLEERLRQIIRRGEALVLSRSNAVLVESQAAADAAVALGAPADRVHIMLPAVDDNVFFASTVEVKLHEGMFNVLYASAPDPQRGLPVFLAALAALPPTAIGTLLRGVGHEAEAQAAVDAAGLSQRVVWHDATTAQTLAQAFQGVDAVTLLPAAPEGAVHAGRVPRRALEAMACRRAVVAADTPGLRTLISDGHNGMLVPPADGPLKDALLRLMVDTTLRGKLAQRAAETASGHGWTVRQAQYRALYQDLLGVVLGSPDTSPVPLRTRPQAVAARTVVRDEKAARSVAVAAVPAPGFLADPTPATDSLEPTPLPVLEEATMDGYADGMDPWGGDTVAVADAPAPMFEPTPAPADGPAPAAEGARAQAGPTLSLPTMRGPVGMRSLAVLDAMVDEISGAGRPVPGDDTERLELTHSHMNALYGQGGGGRPTATAASAAAAAAAKFGAELNSEVPTHQILRPDGPQAAALADQRATEPKKPAKTDVRDEATPLGDEPTPSS